MIEYFATEEQVNTFVFDTAVKLNKFPAGYDTILLGPDSFILTGNTIKGN